MGSAKDIIVKPIASTDANRIVKALHYSGKVVNNSQLHFGVFLNGKCGGAMSFGPSLDKRKIQGLVDGTGWNEFLELNRMAFADWLPRNSESRAIGYAIRFIKKNYPHIKWIISFSDATQCGDGTIYRASGFLLTGINGKSELVEMPDGEVRHRIACHTDFKLVASMGGGMKSVKKIAAHVGGKVLSGFQLRYIYFIDKAYQSRLTAPIIPFSEIEKRGASMYKGKKITRAASIENDATAIHAVEGGAIPTAALHNIEAI